MNYVCDGGLQKLGRRGAAPLDELRSRRGHSGAAQLHRPRPDREPAAGHLVGVAGGDVDQFVGYAGGVSRDHRPHGGVALPSGGGPAGDSKAAVRVQRDGRVLPAGAAGGDLHVAADPDSEQAAGSVGTPGLLLGPQHVVTGGVERALKRPWVVAGVVAGANATDVGLGETRHQVLETDLRGVHADLGREAVDHPLYCDCRLGTARAPVGVGGHGVGDHVEGSETNVSDLVVAGEHPLRQVGDHA